jgi:hypothetical protein
MSLLRMERKDPLLQLEDEKFALAQALSASTLEIAALREQARRSEQALERLCRSERGKADGTARTEDLLHRARSFEEKVRALRREVKVLKDVEARKSRALEQLEASLTRNAEEGAVNAITHAQEVAVLKTRLDHADALARRHAEREREHVQLASDVGALQRADEARLREWSAERRRLKEEARAATGGRWEVCVRRGAPVALAPPHAPQPR